MWVCSVMVCGGRFSVTRTRTVSVSPTWARAKKRSVCVRYSVPGPGSRLPSTAENSEPSHIDGAGCTRSSEPVAGRAGQIDRIEIAADVSEHIKIVRRHDARDELLVANVQIVEGLVRAHRFPTRPHGRRSAAFYPGRWQRDNRLAQPGPRPVSCRSRDAADVRMGEAQPPLCGQAPQVFGVHTAHCLDRLNDLLSAGRISGARISSRDKRTAAACNEHIRCMPKLHFRDDTVRRISCTFETCNGTPSRPQEGE